MSLAHRRNARALRFLQHALLLTVLLPLAGQAETIAMIGTGEVSSALGPRLAALGHRVVYGSRAPQESEVSALVEQTGRDASAALPQEAAQEADIIIVAVPWTVAEQVVIGLGDLSGKILIDPTNPRVVADDGFRDFPTHVSIAERLQLLAPRAFVVKAFNTISVDTMRDPGLFGYAVTVPVVGNDTAAKRKVVDLAEALGYDAIDLGPVRYAHIVEGMYLLRSNARDILGPHFEFRFEERPERKPQPVL